MNSCVCNSGGSTPSPGAASCTPAVSDLPAIETTVMPRVKQTAIFRWTTNSDGDPLLEIEMAGHIRWFEVLTVKP